MKKLLIFLIIAIPLVVIVLVNLTVSTVSGFVPISVESVVISQVSLTGNINEKHKLSAKILPDNATNQELVWESDNESVATVAEDGTVSLVGLGKGYITVTTVDGNKSASCYFYSTDSVAHSVVLSASAKRLEMGDIVNLRASVYPAEAENKDVVFSSYNPDIATVDDNGVVTAHKNGYATILATTVEGGYTDTITIEVATFVQSVAFSKKDITVGDGYVYLDYSVSPSSSTNKKVLFTSDNTALATVNSYGLVMFSGAGTVNILVTTEDGQHVDRCSVTNTEHYYSDLIINSSFVSGKPGDASVYIDYSALPTNVDSQHLSFLSDDTNICSVDNNGCITFVGGGVTLVRVRAYTDSENYIEKSVSVTVDVDAEDITIDDEHYTAERTYQLNPKSFPDTSTNTDFFYHSLTPHIASVSQDGLVTFMATTYETAKIQIYANEDNSSISKTINVLYTNGLPVSYEINDTIDLYVGESDNISVALYPRNSNVDSITYSVIDSIPKAKVLSDGTVIAIAGGISHIETSVELFDGSLLKKICFVNVISLAEDINFATSLEILNDVYYTANPTILLNATVLPVDATNKSVIWSIVSGSAIIDNSNLIFNNRGKVTLKCQSQDENVTKFFEISYVGNSPTSCVLSSVPTKLNVGESFEFGLDTYFPSNASNINISVSLTNQITLALNSPVFSVENNKITALCGGSATVIVWIGSSVMHTYNIESIALPTSIVPNQGNISTTKSSFKLAYSVFPIDATDKSVSFISLTESLISVSEDGVVNISSIGSGQIKIISNADDSIYCVVDVEKVEKGQGNISPVGDEIVLGLGENNYINISDSYDSLEFSLISQLPLTEGNTVISVTEDGLISALSLGTAVVACELFDELDLSIKTYHFNVLIRQLSESIEFNGDIDYNNGEYVTAKNIVDLTYDVFPLNTMNKRVESQILSSYTQSGVAASGIAYIDNGKLIFNQAGVVVIYAKAEDGGSDITIRIKSTYGDAISISLNVNNEINLNIGEFIDIYIVSVFPKDATNLSLHISEILHTQGLNEVVSIEGTRLTAVNNGFSKVNVEISSTITKIITINVLRRVESIDYLSEVLISKTTYTLYPTVSPSNATNKTLIYTMTSGTCATLVGRTLTFNFAGTVEILISSTDGSNVFKTTRITSTMGLPSQVILASQSKTIQKGSTYNIVVSSFLPSDLISAVVSYSVHSQSPITFGETVLTVDENGLVRGVSGGTAIVRVQTTNGIYSDCEITVYSTAVDIEAVFDDTLFYEGTYITALPSLNYSINVFPLDATNKNYSFIVSDSSIAVLNVSEKTIRFLKEGRVSIKFICSDSTFGEISALYNFYYTNGKLLKIDLDNSTLIDRTIKLNYGNLHTFSILKMVPANYDSSDFSFEIVSESRVYHSTSVVDFTVDSVCAIGGGSAVINVSFGGLDCGNYNVQVTRRATRIIPEKKNYFTSVSTIIVSASALPNDATDKQIVYSSLNPEIASVDANTGLVTFISYGVARIIATLKSDNTISETINIDYSNKVKYIEFGTSQDTLFINENLALNIIGNPYGCEAFTLAYTSSATDIAYVTSTGRLVAKNITGTVIIRAYVIEDQSIYCERLFTIISYISDIELALDAVDDNCGLGGYRVFGMLSFDYYIPIAPKATPQFNMVIKSITPATTDYASLMWSSSNLSIATVDSNGVVTFIAAGVVTITVQPIVQYSSVYILKDSYTFRVVSGVNIYNNTDLLASYTSETGRGFAKIIHSDIVISSDISTVELYNHLYGNGHILDASNINGLNKFFVGASRCKIDNITLKGYTFSANAQLQELENTGRTLCISGPPTAQIVDVVIKNTIIENCKTNEIYTAQVSFLGCIIRNTFNGGITITHAPGLAVPCDILVKDCVFSRCMMGGVNFNFDDSSESDIEKYKNKLRFEGKIYMYNWIKASEFGGAELSEIIPNISNEIVKYFANYPQYVYNYNGESYINIGVTWIKAGLEGVAQYYSNGDIDYSKIDESTPYTLANLYGTLSVYGVAVTGNLKILTMYADDAWITPTMSYENDATIYKNIRQPL